MMSFEVREPKPATDQLIGARFAGPVTLPRAPISIARDTTCSNGGSERKAFGTRQGSVGSAQLSSAAVGERLDSL